MTRPPGTHASRNRGSIPASEQRSHFASRHAFTLIELLACQPTCAAEPRRSSKPWRRQVRSAFTLIELLVVISIVSLLISLLLPALSQARTIANRTGCAVNLRSIGIAVISYAADNEGWPPYPYFDLSDPVSTWSSNFGHRIWDHTKFVQAVDQEYLDDGRVWFCPSQQYATYDKDWQRLFKNLNGNGFYLSYCIQMWRRKLDTPADNMFAHLGARKVFMFDPVIDATAGGWLWGPNHLGDRGDRAKSSGQNQLWTDGSVVWAEGWVSFIAGYAYDFYGDEFFTTERDYNDIWNASGNWWK